MDLHSIKPAMGSTKRSKRVGRGLSKGGTYSGRGVKGQRARAGGRAGLQLKGIRTLMLKLPKRRGFNSLAPKPVVVNLRAIDKTFADGAMVTPHALTKKGLIADAHAGVKILGEGELTHKVTFKHCIVSAPAKVKIEKAGGTVL